MKDEASRKGGTRGIRLTEDDEAAFREIQTQYGISGFSQTVCYLIREYPRLWKENIKLREENERLREENKKQMTRIRLASNGADINGQIIIEVLNTLCWQLGSKEYVSTQQMLHPVVEESQMTVKDRIAHFKQAKDSKTKSHK